MDRNRLDIYVDVLTFLIKNSQKGHRPIEIIGGLYGENSTDAINSDVKRALSFLLDSGIVEKETIEKKLGAWYKLSDELICNSKTEEGMKKIARTIISLFMTDSYMSIYDSIIQNVMGSTIFGFHTALMRNTMSQIVIAPYQISDSGYTLPLLLQLAKLQSEVNLSVQSGKSQIVMNGTIIQQLVLNEEGFEIKTDNASVLVNDPKEIQSIEVANADPVESNIAELKKVMDDYDAESTQPINELIEEYQKFKEMFMA